MTRRGKRYIPITSYPHISLVPQEDPTQQTVIEDGEVIEQTTSAPQEDPTQQTVIEDDEIKKYGTGKPVRVIMRARIAYDKGSEGP